MNSLELINKLILEKKTDIKVHKEILQIDNSKKVFHNVVIRECEEFITALQQIKTILEAWEVVKNGTIQIKETFVDKDCNDNVVITIIFKEKDFGTFEKALKVEDV